MLIITGSIGFDYIMDFPGTFADRIMPDKIHKISLSFLVDKLKKQWGGTGGNIAYTLGLLGNHPTLFATAGNDFAPYKKFLDTHNVDTSYVKEYPNASTGSYFVITDREDNQIGAFYTGAMRQAKNLSLSTMKLKENPFVVIAANDPDAMRKYVTQCQSSKIPYMYDPAFQIDNFSKTDLKKAVTKCEILIGNDYEIDLILKKLVWNKKQLVESVPIIITTLGSKGAKIEAKPTTITIKPAKPIKIIDPTGAGDCFRAGFLAGYRRGFDLQTCGQMGALAAVYTVEKYGTTTHQFTRKSFEKRYRENYHQSLTL